VFQPAPRPSGPLPPELKAAAVETEEIRSFHARLKCLRDLTDEGWAGLRQKLFAGELKVYLLFPRGGQPWLIPAEVWSSKLYDRAYRGDQLTIYVENPDPYGAPTIRHTGYPIVSRSELDAVVGCAAMAIPEKPNTVLLGAEDDVGVEAPISRDRSAAELPSRGGAKTVGIALARAAIWKNGDPPSGLSKKDRNVEINKWLLGNGHSQVDARTIRREFNGC
jgi:hypothetical protein